MTTINRSRNRTITISRFFAALLCAALIQASARATDYGDISIRVETVTSGISGSGYDEYRAMIINRSKTQPHRVTLILSFGSTGSETFEARRAVEVAPSSTATISLFKPPQTYASEAIVLIDGARQEISPAIGTSNTNAWVSRSENKFFLLVSREVEKSGLMSDASVVEGFKNAKGENDVAHLAYPSPIQEWSANWLGYSSFDGVIVRAEELRDASDGARSALLRYVECGGSLVVIGEWAPPQQWRSRGIIIRGAEANAEQPGSLTFAESHDAWRYHVGFGELIATGSVNPKLLTPAQWQAIKLGWTESRPEPRNYYEITEINREFAVIERIGVPVRGLFALMLAFVILIGPINLIWLARRRKKIWMLWTTPAIALVTCAAVAGFALFGEGVSATSRTESLTILDETSHRATTIGWTAFYSPITPGDGLHFSFDTELMPQRPESWRYRGGASGTRVIDWSNDQHLAAAWITARVPVYFKFRKSETRRERLTIRPSGSGAISVVNGLGADIRKLWVADLSGKIHEAREIKAGAQADLTLSGLQASGSVSALRNALGDSDWLGRMTKIEQNAAQHLRPGCYLAALDSTPFVEEGLSNVKTRKPRALVYGVSAEVER